MPVIPFHSLAALQSLSRHRPTARKLLVAPDVNWGRDILLTLARHTGGWVGWEVATLRGIAGELALVALDRADTRAGGDVELALLVDAALDQAVASGEVAPRFASLVGGLGFRAAVRDSLLEARTAGLTPAQLVAVAAEGTPARDLAAVLRRYGMLLAERRIADPATLFAAALGEFDRESAFVLPEVIVVAPEVRAAGLPGRLLARLFDAGARVLPADPAAALEPPERAAAAVAAARGLEPWPLAVEDRGPPDATQRDLFAASTPTNEIREALRRVLAEGRQWDEVELVATDPDTYGVALDAVCRQLEIGYSALNGLPLARTRIGRALDRWLDWIADGLPADTLREALEAGDLGASAAGAAPSALARMLRPLQIGWGRDRYIAAIARLRDPAFLAGTYRPDDEDDTAFAARVSARATTARALADLLGRLVELVPEVPERGSDRVVTTSVAALAHAALGYLDLVPSHGAEGETQTLARLRTRLAALAAADEITTGEPPEVRFSMALAQLRDALGDLRAWTALSDDRKPWSPAGGRVHLTDLAHAGLSGRPRTFVVGLDADRVSGARTQDPILNDTIRRALESDGLPPTTVRRQERAYWTSHALARLRGTITLSFAVAGEDGERATGPAHLLLETLRAERDDPSLSYEDLRAALGAPACAVPAAAEQILDARDAWLAAIGAGPLLLDADSAVREAWPRLAAALHARDVRNGHELTAYHGLVSAAAGALDPRDNGHTVSPTSLELLGKCPMAWFYKYGIHIRPPGDPEYDAEAWLDSLARGSLLHALYETVGKAFHRRQDELVLDAARDRVLATADTLLAEWRDKVPPPSEAVYESEAREIRESALAFLDSEREALADGRGRWHSFELDLGKPEPTRIGLSDGRALRVIGKVDRVDVLDDGTLVVIDFKTGGAGRYRQDRKRGLFDGGRLLQASVYPAAVEARRLGTVQSFEYRFPTRRGENISVPFGPDELARGREILPGLLDHLARGEFIATDDSNDCAYCDYQAVCRSVRGEWNKTDSPRAAWAAEHGGSHTPYAAMIARRTPDGAE